jgi:outer membrane protein TolC
MRRALRRHPDYLALQEVIKQEGVRVAYTQSQRWPQLDLLASYGLNGIGETASESYDQGWEGDYQPWSVGVELRIPLGGGVKERAELAAARMRQKQALLEVKTAEVEIGNALDTAMRRVSSTHEQAVHTKTAAEANARLLESEMSRLDAGKSDSRRVLQIEQEWVDARIANYQGLVEHRRAWLDLEVAQGIMLDNRGLEPAVVQ